MFARGAQVGLLEHKYGILPDLGGTQRLPRVVGASKAKELIWTAARIDADESYRIGLCDRLVDEADLDAEVTTLAAVIAAQPPLAVQGVKRCAIEAADRLPVAEGLVVEAEEQRVCRVRRHARGDQRVRRAASAAIQKVTDSLGCAPRMFLMTRFRVRASGPLEGRVEVAGATKNSGVKQMAAALLAPGVTTLRNMPPVLDLDVMSDLLRGRRRRRSAGTQRRARRRVGVVAARSALRARQPYARVVQRARAVARALR